MAAAKKPTAKKAVDPSSTKPYNVKLMKPKDIVEKKPTAKPKVTPKPAMPTKRPAVGADVAAKKKYGPSSHNNGYTN